MSKTLKKITALMLTAIMLLSVSLVCFAGEPVTLDVKEVDGSSLILTEITAESSVYKVYPDVGDYTFYDVSNNYVLAEDKDRNVIKIDITQASVTGFPENFWAYNNEYDGDKFTYELLGVGLYDYNNFRVTYYEGKYYFICYILQRYRETGATNNTFSGYVCTDDFVNYYYSDNIPFRVPRNIISGEIDEGGSLEIRYLTTYNNKYVYYRIDETDRIFISEDLEHFRTVYLPDMKNAELLSSFDASTVLPRCVNTANGLIFYLEAYPMMYKSIPDFWYTQDLENFTPISMEGLVLKTEDDYDPNRKTNTRVNVEFLNSVNPDKTEVFLNNAIQSFYKGEYDIDTVSNEEGAVYLFDENNLRFVKKIPFSVKDPVFSLYDGNAGIVDCYDGKVISLDSETNEYYLGKYKIRRSVASFKEGAEGSELAYYAAQSDDGTILYTNDKFKTVYSIHLDLKNGQYIGLRDVSGDGIVVNIYNNSIVDASAYLISVAEMDEKLPEADEWVSFPDVPRDAWYYEAVKYCAQHKYVHGYESGLFGPNDNLQRQDFVVMLANIAGADLSGYTSCKLTDVQMSAYYGKAVAWAVDNGIIAGYQNGKFGVGDPITREQAATILYRYVQSPEVDDVEATLERFPDRDSISEFALTPLAWAVQNNVLTGMQDGTANPKGTAVRAQIASIIMRMDQSGLFNIF